MDKSINSDLTRQAAERFKLLRVHWTAFAARRLRPLGIVPNQAVFLRTLHDLGPCSLSEIAAGTHIDPAAVVRLADSLTERGWVARQEHPTDRRRWRVCLSPGGNKMAQKCNAIFEVLHREIFSPLTAEELARFNDLLGKLWTPHDPDKPGSEPKQTKKRTKP